MYASTLRKATIVGFLTITLAASLAAAPTRHETARERLERQRAHERQVELFRSQHLGGQLTREQFEAKIREMTQINLYRDANPNWKSYDRTYNERRQREYWNDASRRQHLLEKQRAEQRRHDQWLKNERGKKQWNDRRDDNRRYDNDRRDNRNDNRNGRDNRNNSGRNNNDRRDNGHRR